MGRLFGTIFLSLACMTGLFGSALAQEKPEIFVQVGHLGYLSAVAFSSDGKYLVTGGTDDSVKLWNATSASEIATYKGHSENVTAVAISPDAKYVVSGDEKGTIKLWSVATGKEIKSINTGKEKISFLSFSPDAQTFTSIVFTTLTQWSVSSGQPVKTIERMRGGIWIAAGNRYVSAESKTSFSSSSLLDVSTATVIAEKTLKPESMTFWSTSFSRDGKHGLFLSDDYKSNRKIFEFMDITTGQKIASWDADKDIQGATLSPDGKTALSLGIGSLKLWDVISGKELRTLTTSHTTTADFSPDGRFIISAGLYAPTLWDVASGAIVRSYQGRSLASPQYSSFSAEGKQAVVNFQNAPPVLWDITAGNVSRTFTGYARASFMANGKYILLYSNDQTIALWDLSADKIVKSFKSQYVTISSDLKTVAQMTTTRNVKVSEIATDREITSFTEPSGDLLYMFFTSDNKYLLTALKNGAKLMEVSTGREIRSFTLPEGGTLWTAGISPDGKTIAAIYIGASPDFKNMLKLWDANSGREIKTFIDVIPAASFSFSPDSRYLLLAAGKEYNLVLCDTTTGRELRTFQGHKGVIWSQGFSNDGKTIISGSFDKDIKSWDATTGAEIMTYAGHRYAIGSAKIYPDSRHILSTSNDGTTRFWDFATGKEIAQFFSFADGEWIVITTEGTFNASPNGAKYLNVRVGSNVYDIDQFYEKFFNPVSVASALQGKPVVAGADIRRGFALPPDVKIISPEPNASFSNDNISITVSAKDNGGGIDEIKLYHNGKAIGEEQRGIKVVPKGNESTKTYNVILVDGINAFRAIGFSKDRTESNPAELSVTLTAPQKEVSLYVLAIGINKYKNPALNLNYAEPDAKGLIDFFNDNAKGLFKNIALAGIYNEQATKETIVSKLTQLQNTQPQDVVVIYLASHGENLNEKWYLIPHELTYPEREDEVKAKGLSSDELAGYIKGIRAQKVLLLVDACKSGAVLIAFRGFEDRKALSQLSRSAGVHIIAASTKDQFAAEVKDLGHGVFTYTLLEGLNGKASGGSSTITVRKLMGYVEEQLPEITKRYKQEAQYPVVDSKGMDFPLMLVK